MNIFLIKQKPTSAWLLPCLQISKKHYLALGM